MSVKKLIDTGENKQHLISSFKIQNVTFDTRPLKAVNKSPDNVHCQRHWTFATITICYETIITFKGWEWIISCIKTEQWDLDIMDLVINRSIVVVWLIIVITKQTCRELPVKVTYCLTLSTTTKHRLASSDNLSSSSSAGMPYRSIAVSSTQCQSKCLWEVTSELPKYHHSTTSYPASSLMIN